MASLDMSSPFALTNEEIDKQVTKTAPGNYALGDVDQSNTFIVQYVGRSDTNLNARLKSHVGEHPKFKYSYSTSAKTAFEKECKNFHDFGGSDKLKNKVHPDRPKNSDWKCPYCKNFG